jgi:hypothetical protein
MDEGATLLSLSLLMKNEALPPYSLYAGVPAKRCADADLLAAMRQFFSSMSLQLGGL